ncbi:MAG: ABC transporter ATP-binding protein [Proteobacteria bacterium]|nr:ABC transporter ATP-binding protein [Pseudomonadota bacterium]
MSTNNASGTPADGMVLSVRNLSIDLVAKNNRKSIVSDINFDVGKGETVCIVGESGSGKSVTALSLMSLTMPPLAIGGGEIYLNGQNLASLSRLERERQLGHQIAMVFQDPMTALNPVMRIGEQITESLARHQPELSRQQQWQRAEDLLQLVGVPSPRERLSVYPHEMSGGMRQRILIAIALANNPQLIIADEPTTALDVTVQAQVLEVMQEACRHAGAAILLITHDMGVVAECADRVFVMYAGRIVEQAPVTELFKRPRHPYTRALLDSIPDLHSPPDEDLSTVTGDPPDIFNLPSGCAFRTRCGFSNGRSLCSQERPHLRAIDRHHASACHFAEEMAGVDRFGEQD